MAEDKKPIYFYFYLKYCAYFEQLSDEQAGEIIRYICKYAYSPNTTKEFTPKNDTEKLAKIMLVNMIKQDIDNAFHNYIVKSKNGSLGGAPKGNKNAKKAITSEEEYQIISTIISVTEEDGNEDFNVLKAYSNNEFSIIVACINILNVACYKDLLSDFDLRYETLGEYTINVGAKNVCTELKEQAKLYNEKEFTLCYERYKKIAHKWINSKYSIKELDDMCNDYIENRRKQPKNNLKTT